MPPCCPKIYKKIHVVPHDSRWAEQFEREKAAVVDVFGSEIVVHHIGSTSVPGLAAKPTIDILAVLHDPAASVSAWESLGYAYKGECNIPFQYMFTKRDPVRFNLHVFAPNHPEIELNLTFRDALRANTDLRDAYAALKHELLQDPAAQEKSGGMFVGYTLGKGPFIQSVLRAAGFSRLRLLKCTAPTEWEAFRRFFGPAPSDFSAAHVVYKGVDMIGAADTTPNRPFLVLAPAYADLYDEALFTLNNLQK